jgi:hypothetical protein
MIAASIATAAVLLPAAARRPITATQMRVYPPGAYASLQFGFSIAACSQAGPVYLHVSPITRGTGIPGYSI